MDQNRYPKNCYVMLKNDDDRGKVNRVSKVRQFLYSLALFGYLKRLKMYHILSK